MRRVRRLQLSAPNEGLLWRGQLLLEDALRTASLPGAEDARLYLVRSLRLGVIDPRGSPARLARTIEERLRQSGLTACPGDDPAAEHAPVVVFASALEASIALAVRIGRGVSVRGWHWPLAVPAFRPGADPAESLRALLLASFELPGEAAASASWLEALVEADAAEPLLASLSAAEAEGLLRLGGWEPTPPRPGMGPDQPGPTATLPPVWRAPLGRWLRRWGPEDPRGLWLVAMALVARQPARIGSAAVLGQARAYLQAEGGPRALGLPDSAPTSPAPNAGTGEQPPPSAAGPKPSDPAAKRRTLPGPGALPGQPSSPDGAPPAQLGMPQSALPEATLAPATASGGTPTGQGHLAGDFPVPDGPPKVSLGRPQDAEGAAPPLPSPDPAAAPEVGPARPTRHPWAGVHGLGEPSAFAGLAFLVVLLRLEGIDGWLERYPALLDADWPRRLLRGLADGLGVPLADPLRVALGLEAPAPLTASGATPLEERAVVASASRHWRRRLRRWCRRPGRPALVVLVRRPGTVVVSRTHLEVWFEPRQAEIRVRRHGLDLDPGWVPWLGRVVTFHYDRRGPGDGEG